MCRWNNDEMRSLQIEKGRRWPEKARTLIKISIRRRHCRFLLLSSIFLSAFFLFVFHCRFLFGRRQHIAPAKTLDSSSEWDIKSSQHNFSSEERPRRLIGSVLGLFSSIKTDRKSIKASKKSHHHHLNERVGKRGEERNYSENLCRREESSFAHRVYRFER